MSAKKTPRDGDGAARNGLRPRAVADGADRADSIYRGIRFQEGSGR